MTEVFAPVVFNWDCQAHVIGIKLLSPLPFAFEWGSFSFAGGTAISGKGTAFC